PAHPYYRNTVYVEHVYRIIKVLQHQHDDGENEEIAQNNDTYRSQVLDEGLEQRSHLAHADVVQRHNLHRKARRQRTARAAELRRDVAAHRGGRGQYLPDAALPGHRRAVHAQQHLHRRVQRFARDPRGRANGDGAADGGVDGVRLVEDVAQDVAHHLTDVGGFEIERHRGPLRRRRLLDRRHVAAFFLPGDQHPGALVEPGLLGRPLGGPLRPGFGRG